MSLRLVVLDGEVSLDYPRWARRQRPTRPRLPSGAGRRGGTFARVRTNAWTRALTRSTIAIALTGALLAGCGPSDDEADPAGAPTPAASTSAAPGPTDSGVPTPEPAPTETEPPGGSGDGEEDDKPATAGGGICSDLEAEAVGAVLGGATVGTGLAPRGCEFRQASSRAPSATFVESSAAGASGGMDGAKSNATASVEGEPEDLTGIGSAAFVVTGTVFGGTDVQGAGAVRVGDRLIEITLSQRQGISAATVRSLLVGLLELAADQAS